MTGRQGTGPPTGTPLTAETRRRLAGSTSVWLLSVGLLIASAAMWWLAVRHLGPLDAPLHLPAWLMAVGFAVAETKPVHIQLRRDAHSFSLSEIPFVLGLFFTSPGGLVLAQVVGLTAALVFHRRQSAQKVLFNIGHWSLGGLAGIALFRSLVEGVDPVSAPGWLIALLAAAVASLVSVLAIFLAISFSEGRMSMVKLRQIAGLAGIGTMTNASLALVGVVTAWYDPWAALLLAFPTTIIYLSYRAYISQRQRHETLEFLYESSRALHESQGIETALGGLLSQARTTFRARVAELVLAPPRPGDPALRMRLDDDEIPDSLEPIEFDSFGADALEDLGNRGAILVRPGAVDSDAVTSYLRSREVASDALIAPLSGETRPLGVLLLGERLGDVSYFDNEDLRLFGTLANHVSSSLEVGRLEKTLDNLTELKDELRHRAYHDALTGLANRSLFADEVDEALANGRDGVAVVFFDLDDFKLVNDSLGHGVGDELLVAVSGRLQASLKDNDLPARLGGDEFAVLLRDIEDVRQAEQVVRRIIAGMAPTFVVGDEQTVRCHLSVGIATPDETVETGADLLRNADVAMYEAKRDSKGGYRVFTPEMHDAASKRLSQRGELLLALNNDQFRLHLQPLVDLVDEAPLGVECLIRWQHPEEGLLGPDRFIDVAEETGLIVPIGGWVLREACTRAAEWTEPLMVSVNISPTQLQRSDVVAEVRAALRLSGLDPARLLLEVTETEVMRDFDASRRVLDELAGLGVQLALDDFGTGYSSMEHLAQLPFHVLKIAKTFVDGIGQPGSQALVARAIVDLAHGLELRTIAEGIEHAHQAEALREWGCDIGQGFHFGRPVPEVDSTAVTRTMGVSG